LSTYQLGNDLIDGRRWRVWRTSSSKVHETSPAASDVRRNASLRERNERHQRRANSSCIGPPCTSRLTV